MLHFVYKTTNLINNKFYYGAHSTTDIDDGYIGSGSVLLKAIKKYGKKAFLREVIAFFNTREDMFEFEELLISHILESDNSYNVMSGGDCGPVMYGPDNFMFGKKGELSPNFGIKRSPETIERMKASNANRGKPMSKETREKVSNSRKGKASHNSPHSEETKRKISESRKGKVGKPSGWTHSEETKAKMKAYWENKRQLKEAQKHG